MRPPNPLARQQIAIALRRGPISTPQLAAALSVSPRTVLRLVAELSAQCIAAGAAGRRRYALRRSLRGEAAPIPTFTIERTGRVTAAGELHLIAPEGSLFDLAALGWPIDPAARDGWWGGLPYPIYDMRPQGFLGRAFAQREHQALDVPADPREWGDDAIVYALTRRGADMPGNLILGEPALRLFQATLTADAAPIKAARTNAEYARLADETVAHGVVGSSAAGEFPKFTAIRDLRGSLTPHVIVKFSSAERGAAAERWSDLLVCEHLALAQAGRLTDLAAARTRLIQAEGRTFLESERFDRHGDLGRSACISLDALNGHLLGLSTTGWRAQAYALAKRAVLTPQGLAAVTRVWWFGRLIANGDMHLGNLSFVPGAGRLTIAPAYDMLPMAYAPLPGGEVPPTQWVFEMPLPAETIAWHDAATLALVFWREASSDTRISPRFRSICRDNARALARLADRV